MEITIRLADGETQVAATPAAAQPSTLPASAPPDVLARAEAIGAINAGPAPTGPGAAGDPLAQIGAVETAATGVEATSSGMSAGAAPGSPQGHAVVLPEAES
jgi:hypothetical protein